MQDRPLNRLSEAPGYLWQRLFEVFLELSYGDVEKIVFLNYDWE